MGAGASATPGYVNQTTVNDELYREIEKRCKSGFYVKNPDKYKETIEGAIRGTRLDLLELLIPAGKCREALPVHTACSLAKLESLELLISAGFPVNTADEDGRTPLYHCSHTKNSDAALCATAIMLTSSKAVRTKDYCGDSALHYAVQQRNKYVVNAICDEAEFGGSVQQANKVAKSNYFDIAPVTEVKDKKGNTPLSLAAKLGYKDMLEVFAERDAAAVEAKRVEKKKEEVSMERIMQIWDAFFTNAMNHMGEEMAQEDEVGGFMYGELGRSGSGSARSTASGAVMGWREYGPADEEEVFGHIVGKHQQVRGKKAQAQAGVLGSSSEKSVGARTPGKGKYTDMKPGGMSRAQSSRGSVPPPADFSYRNPTTSSSSRNGLGINGLTNRAPSPEALNAWLSSWLLCFSDYEQRYYVVDTSAADRQTFESLWVEDFLELMRSSILHRAFGSAAEVQAEGGGDSSLAAFMDDDDLPGSFADAYVRYWLTYYDLEYNSCYWMQLTTGRCEYYLPLMGAAADPDPEPEAEPEPEPEPDFDGGKEELVYDPSAGKYVSKRPKKKTTTSKSNRGKEQQRSGGEVGQDQGLAVDPELVWEGGWVAAHQAHVTYAWALVISCVDALEPEAREDKYAGEKEGGVSDAKATAGGCNKNDYMADAKAVSGWDQHSAAWGGAAEAPPLPPVYKYLNTVTNQVALEPPLHWVEIVYAYNNTTEAQAKSDGVALWYYCCNEDLVVPEGSEGGSLGQAERQLSHYYWWNIETNETTWA